MENLYNFTQMVGYFDSRHRPRENYVLATYGAYWGVSYMVHQIKERRLKETIENLLLRGLLDVGNSS